jgi:hypothetical protein
MNSDARSFAFLLATAESLLAQVTGRDHLANRPAYLRPAHVRPVMVRRLASGLRVLASFVRRFLVLMALSLEHQLTDRIDPAGLPARPHRRKQASGLRFAVLEPAFTGTRVVAGAQAVFHWEDGWQDRAESKPAGRPSAPSAARLYRMLDLLAAIVANPEPRARRLAWHLARTRHGPVLPPRGPQRIAGQWGTDVGTSHEAMACAILKAGRERPPPLAPPRRALPTVTGL